MLKYTHFISENIINFNFNAKFSRKNLESHEKALYLCSQKESTLLKSDYDLTQFSPYFSSYPHFVRCPNMVTKCLKKYDNQR